MKTIPLKEIMKEKGLKTKEVAEHLFPENQNPSNALHRILNGEAELRASQVSKFSTLTGIPIADLFKPSGWTSKRAGDAIIFKKGRYTATYDTQHGIISLCDTRSLFHEAVVLKKSITLDQTLAELESIIKQHVENESRN